MAPTGVGQIVEIKGNFSQITDLGSDLWVRNGPPGQHSCFIGGHCLTYEQRREVLCKARLLVVRWHLQRLLPQLLQSIHSRICDYRPSRYCDTTHVVVMLVLLILVLVGGVNAIDLPLAPSNVKVYCRQGKRFTRAGQTAVLCPSSSSACGYFEFSTPDEKGINNTGIFECVEAGILAEAQSADHMEYEDDEIEPLFANLCGAQPSCSSLDLEALNPAFLKHLVTSYDLKLETLLSTQFRYCCSLFHNSLQKLVISGKDRLPSASAPSMHCSGEVCGEGAVGCLLHSKSLEDEDYEEKRLRREANVEDDLGIMTVQLDIDYEQELELEMNNSMLEEVASTTLPSLKLPLAVPHLTKTKNGVKYAVVEDDEYEDESEEETHCVYRHLNDELYRWCLFVYQSRNVDRCYARHGHTICCCFVPPDKDTCDPTEMDLVQPPPPPKQPFRMKAPVMFENLFLATLFLKKRIDLFFHPISFFKSLHIKNSISVLIELLFVFSHCLDHSSTNNNDNNNNHNSSNNNNNNNNDDDDDDDEENSSCTVYSNYGSS